MTITATSIDLTWTAPAGGGAVTGYTVLSRVTGSGAFAIQVSGVSGTAWTVSGLVPSTSYDFAVYAGNSAGPGALSGVVTAETLGEVPNPPGSFAASAGSPAYSAVNLTWTASPTDSTHGAPYAYRVAYSENNTGIWTVYASGIAGLSTTITGLPHDTLYGFRVDAYNAAGNDATGATTTLTTDFAPPNAPSIGSVAPVPDGTTSKLAVTWSTPSTDATHDAATGYNLRYRIHDAITWTTLTGVSSGAVITGLSASTAYDVQVQATNGSTTSPGAWSASGTAGTWTVGLAVVQPLPTPYSFAHGSYPIVQVAMTGTFTTVQGTWGSSANVVPSSGWTAFGPYGGWETALQVQYLNGGASASAGTVYLWVQALDGSGNVIGEIAASGYTAT